jgi:hypothetical protein
MTSINPALGAATGVPCKFREIRLRDPHENIFTALAIIQSHILASDSALNKEALFGPNDYTGQADLELAVSLLVAAVEEVERLEWSDDAGAMQ